MTTQQLNPQLKQLTSEFSTQDRLSLVLTLLQQARSKLVQDFLEESPEIYAPSFRYERNEEMLQLAREKYVVSWLNSHWELLENLLTTQFSDMTQCNVFKEEFAKAFLELLRKFGVQIQHPQNSEFFALLLRKKAQTLEEILKISDKSEQQFEKLKYSDEREKALFNREMNRLLDQT